MKEVIIEYIQLQGDSQGHCWLGSHRHSGVAWPCFYTGVSWTLSKWLSEVVECLPRVWKGALLILTEPYYAIAHYMIYVFISFQFLPKST
jgi:hypothetical protein